MPTGTGNLPYPGKVYVPFDILTAQELNEDVANIESLATGTGIGDGAVTTAKIAQGYVGYANIGNFATGGNGYVFTFKQNALQLTGLTVGRQYVVIGSIGGLYTNVGNKASSVALYLDNTTSICSANQANSSATFQKWPGSMLGMFTATSTGHDIDVRCAVDSGTTQFVESMRVLVL